MNADQLEHLNNTKKKVTSVSALDGTTKTLLYGYTTDRDTHHVYQEAGELHLLVYNRDQQLLDHRHGHDLPIDGITPNKRLYPESCDFDFCLQLKELGVNLPFTNYDPERAEKLADRELHGSTAHDFNVAVA